MDWRERFSGRLAARRALAAACSAGAFCALLSAAAAESPIRFRDVTPESGITFVHSHGGCGARFIMEAMSAGLVLFDYDGDGDDDVYFLNGAPLKGSKADQLPTNALYRNDGAFHFTDVTAEAGVADTGYALGATAGDYDNDGDLDLYVNNFGPNVLYRNNGDGTFTDVTRQAGVANGNKVGAGVCFLDADADGDLDLYVANYVKFSYDSHVLHFLMGLPSYPSPLDHAPEPDVLYRNQSDGTFADVSEQSQIGLVAGTSMGMVCCDYDADGDTDIFVGNDVMPNFLFQNDGTGKFTEVGAISGVAYDIAGIPHGSMGTDFADSDNDGLLDLFVTSYGGELSTLYRNLGGGFFEDATRQTGAGASTFPHVTWGHGFVDFDNDGYRDLFIACGDLDDNVALRKGTTAYELPNMLMRNTGDGKFVDVSSESGDGMKVKRSSRGAAFGDLDNDGRVDVVVLNSCAGPTVLRNESPGAGHWLQVDLRGKRSNRFGVGSQVKVTAGDLTLVDEVHSGRSYQSHFGMRLHFGLGKQEHVDRIDVRWIGGGIDVLENLDVDQCLTITEGSAEAKRATSPTSLSLNVAAEDFQEFR